MSDIYLDILMIDFEFRYMLIFHTSLNGLKPEKQTIVFVIFFVINAVFHKDTQNPFKKSF